VLRYHPVAVPLLSEIVVDTLHPFDFLGPKDTKASRDAGLKMFSRMRTMWGSLLPYTYSWAKDVDSEAEEEDLRFDDDDTDDLYDDEDDDHIV
jgi:hypothetical protein